MAIEMNDEESVARRQKIADGVGDRVRQIYQRTCQIDGVALKPSGVCPVCARQFAAPPLNSSLTAAERKALIADGQVPANTAGLSDDERKAAAFWTKHWADHPDKQHPKTTKEPTMAEKASKFFTEPYESLFWIA